MILTNANPKYSFRGISQSDIIYNGRKMDRMPMSCAMGLLK